MRRRRLTVGPDEGVDALVSGIAEFELIQAVVEAVEQVGLDLKEDGAPPTARDPLSIGSGEPRTACLVYKRRPARAKDPRTLEGIGCCVSTGATEVAVQAAGNRDRMVVELRRDGEPGERHFVIGKSDTIEAEPTEEIQWDANRMHVYRVEAVPLFLSYWQTNDVPQGYRLRALDL